MPELSLRDINQIILDVRSQEIVFSHLADELADHICCEVEYEMGKGLGFNEAYLIVKEKIGHRRLKEIQKETLYAVDTKYRNMKKTMKISAIAGTVLLGFAALFKIMHWAGAGIMLTFGGLSLAFVFLPSALGVLWKETHNRKKLFLYISCFLAVMFFILGVVFKVQHWPGAAVVLSLSALSGILLFIPALLISKLREQDKKSKKIVYILGAVGLISYSLGLLFKIQHWPMATVLVVAGSVLIFLVAFPWYTRITWKDDITVNARFIFMVAGSMALVIPGLMLNLSLQRSYDEGYFRQLEEQQAMFAYEFSNNQSMIINCNDTSLLPVLKDINVRTIELLQAVNETEAKLIAVAEGKPGMPADVSNRIKSTDTGPAIQFTALTRPFNTVPFRDFLQKDSDLKNELASALEKYSGFLSDRLPAEDFGSYARLLDPAAYLPDIDPETGRISMMTGLHILELMKSGILAVESHALSTVSTLNNR
jgi:uncharacterized membrane protein